MGLDPALQSAMLAAVPRMRDFALSLCRKPDGVDDLVQEALTRAIANIGLFEPGTNMAAWLFTILRNNFINELCKRRREVADGGRDLIDTMTSQPDQDARIQLGEFHDALSRLPRDQREAIMLVGGAGLSYDEAAKVCHCAVGTIKSRVFRARMRLAALMSIENPQDLGPDRAMQGVLTAGGSCWAT